MHREVVPADLPPPIVPVSLEPEPEPAADAVDDPTVDNPALEATGWMTPVESEPESEPEVDPRELKALSRQERKEAKAALRREQQEARNAARQAKAAAKAAAKLGAAAPAVSAASDSMTDLAADEPVADDVPEQGDQPTELMEPIEPDEAIETDESDDAVDEADATPVATDPRSRAAQRVQRRLGKDAEKLSAAEARARAREEARRRRAQAKEQRSGVVAEEAVRPPEEPTEGNLTEDVSVVEPLTAQTVVVEPIVDDPVVAERTAEGHSVEHRVEDEQAGASIVGESESDLPKPVFGQRIDEPAPVDEPEAVEAEETEAIELVEVEDLDNVEDDVADEPEPATAWISRVETREIAAPAEADGAKTSRLALAPVAGVVGLIALGISVLLAVGALLVALGLDSGGLYEGLKTVANLLVGPLEGAFDFSGANAERKEHFLAWGAGSIGYLLISFAGQAMQRANDQD